MNEQPEQADYDRVWRYFAVAFVVLAAVVAVAVTIADDDTETVATGDDQASEVTPDQIAAGQTALVAVGCYSGPVDGQYGAQTNQAIRDFQAAAGLQADGVFGPATLEALESAVAAGQTACPSTSGDDGSTGGDESGSDGSTGGDESGSDGSTDGDESESDGSTGGEESESRTATLSSSTYSQIFIVTSWDCTGDAGDVAIQGEADGSTLVVVATGGVGELAVVGEIEQDTLNGEITSVTKTPDTFTADGTFGEPNLVGESFDLSGTC